MPNSARPVASPRALWRVSVHTTAQSEDAVSELMSRFLACPVSSFHDLANHVCRVDAYLESKPRRVAGLEHDLRSGLRGLAAGGLDVGPARVSCRRLGRQDWAESWKRHFPPLAFGGRLRIQPTWSRGRARAGEALVRLDPGLSFGTGHHPTTGFCLAQLVRARRPSQPQSLLDAGTGSGILAIAAAKLGYTPVHAFDFDPQALRVARANARLNRVGGKP